MLRYENVWDGVDIEYREGKGGALRQTIRIAPGAGLPEDAFRVSGAGAEEVRDMFADLLGPYGMMHDAERSGVNASSGSVSMKNEAAEALVKSEPAQSASVTGGFRYKDTLALTMEFNTVLNFDSAYARHHVVSGNGEVTVHGLTANALPVRNAVQGDFNGYGAVFVVGFDSTGQDLRYCTYLFGGSNSWLGFQNIGMIKNFERSMVAGVNGDVYGIMLTGAGAPTLPNSFQEFPEATEGNGYVYRLGSGGRLKGATYIGGPGTLAGVDLAVSDSGVYIVAGNNFENVRTTPGALMPSKPDSSCAAVVLLRLTHDLDSLIFMTYLRVQSRECGRLLETLEGLRWPGDFAVDSEGHIVLSYSVDRDMTDELILPGADPAYYDGYWVARVSSDGRKLLTSRFITDADIPGEFRWTYHGVHHLFARGDGGIDLFGGSRDTGTSLSLPAGWSTQKVLDLQPWAVPDRGTDGAVRIWGMTLSESGELVSGRYYGLSGLGVGGVAHFITPDHTCGGYYHFHWNYRHYDTLFTVDPVSTVRDGRQERFIVNLDKNLNVRYATAWNAAYMTSRYITPVLVDHHGYCYIAPRYDSRMDDCRFFRSWRTSPTPGYDTYLARFRIYTPCWQVGCAISTIDTIGIERRRDYASPEEFTVNYAVTNHSPEKGACIVHAQIELPAGLELVAGSPQQPMTPADLSSGMTAACSWRVRVSDLSVLIESGAADTALIRCRVFYVDPESGQTYPMGEELCEHDIMVVVYDKPDPELVCTVEGPPEVYWRGDGFAATPGGEPGASRYRFTLTNLDSDTVTITDFRYRAGPQCRIAGDSLRSGVLLAPGASYTDEIDVVIGALRYGRLVTVEAAALDEYGVPLSQCTAETAVPGVTDMPCAVTGPAQIVWNTATGTATPAVLPLTLLIDNPLDTMRSDVTLRADLSRAPHLAPSAGESLLRDPFFIITHFRRAFDWQFVLADAPDTHARDTIVFAYEEDGTEYRCEHVVEIHVIDQSVVCTLSGTDTLSAAAMLSSAFGQLHFTVSNAGTVPVDVDRCELAITPAGASTQAGLISLDPLTRPGGSLDPGNDVTLGWNLRALILRESRTAECTVTAYDANDSALAICAHEIFLEGLDGLTCMLSAADTVRFTRAELRYDPEEVTADFTLENLLDTEETNIEAVIDLSQSPRFVLAPTESASKTVAVIDSHSTTDLTWRLIPQPAPKAESQEIVVRYKSEQITEWQECRVTIHIETWPEETSVSCATGGHDSLYADAHYERFIPDPLHVSYTVTNTGTVPLTGCEASIILPPEFVLAGSHSTQSFTAPEYGGEPDGPVAEGTILPNVSCTRWWKITPTQTLEDADPKLIRWRWRSAEQGAESGCEGTIHIVPGNPPGIVLTPLHLYFEAERGGAHPAEQRVQLWTGGGLAMPWTAQPSEWWLDAQPVSGNQSTQIAVQPSSTMLGVGAHGAQLLLAAAPENRRVAVTYIIRKSTGIGEPPAPGALTLDVWPQPVPGGTRLHVRIGGQSGERCRLILHDLLGRERMSREVAAGRSVSLDLAAAQLAAGMYLLRAMSEEGAQAMRMVSIIR